MYVRIKQSVSRRYLQLVEGVATGLVLGHDNGLQYITGHFQNELAFLGIGSSPSFVRTPQGNRSAERFIRTLKELLLWVRRFETVEELLAFQGRFNRHWPLQRHGHQTPA